LAGIWGGGIMRTLQGQICMQIVMANWLAGTAEIG
jgi:hypothetical protein